MRYVIHCRALDVFERKREVAVLADGKYARVMEPTGEFYVRLSPSASFFIGSEPPADIKAGDMLRLTLEKVNANADQ